MTTASRARPHRFSPGSALQGSRLAAVLGIALVSCDPAPSGGTKDSAPAISVEDADTTAQRYAVEPVPLEGVELESEYSRIVIRDDGPLRAMYFRSDDGSLVLQTRVSLADPDRLFLDYQQSMFATYLFSPEPSSVLIAGLGGGAMVRFLQRRDPAVAIDAIDIDPVVVEAAQRYFGTVASETVRLITADAHEHILRSPQRYDAIFIDVFLRPHSGSDAAGVELRIKDAPFYAAIRDRLTPEGVVAFNLLPHPGRPADVAELREAFPQVYLFEVENALNWIAIATLDLERVEIAEMRRRAAALEARFAGSLPFTGMIERCLDGSSETTPAAAALARPSADGASPPVPG